MTLTRMQQRRGADSQWETANPVLASGEIGVNTDNYQFKIGDGISAWSELDYFQNFTQLGDTYATIDDLEALIDIAPETLDTLAELAEAINNDPNFFNTIQGNIDTAIQTLKDEIVLNDLNDVDTYDAADGQALVYDQNTDSWIPGSLTSSLAELEDVDTSGAVDKNALVYSEELDLWIPGEGGGKFTVSPTAPEDPENGDTWFNSETGQSYLFYEDDDSSQWVEIAAPVVGFLDIDQLNDVEIVGAEPGNVLKYNGTQWVNDTIELSDLEDTDVLDPADGDVLAYNASSGNWESSQIPPGVSLGLVIALGG